MVFFDILSLLTNVPPATTIEFIIKRIYNNNDINTCIYKMEIKNYFAMHRGSTFDGKGYVQTNSVMMGSLLDPL